MILLVVLQNAYDRGSLADGWHPSRWRKEYEQSRTGRRLALALPKECSVHYTNANPRMGHGPDSKHEPDVAHLRRRLRAVEPDAVLACGKLAEDAMTAMRDVWLGTLFAIPHPASRVLTNALLVECRTAIVLWMIEGNGMPRQAFRQRRGHTEVETL